MSITYGHTEYIGPRYVPTDQITREMARYIIDREIRHAFERVGLSVTLGELADDGTVPLYAHFEPAEFNVRGMLDYPQINGSAWIEDHDGRPKVWYDFPEQAHTPAESNYASGAPVHFTMRYRPAQ